MKKLALILAILGCVSLSGCGEKAPRNVEEAIGTLFLRGKSSGMKLPKEKRRNKSNLKLEK